MVLFPILAIISSWDYALKGLKDLMFARRCELTLCSSGLLSRIVLCERIKVSEEPAPSFLIGEISNARMLMGLHGQGRIRSRSLARLAHGSNALSSLISHKYKTAYTSERRLVWNVEMHSRFLCFQSSAREFAALWRLSLYVCTEN